jgi:hypothetical protein
LLDIRPVLSVIAWWWRQLFIGMTNASRVVLDLLFDWKVFFGLSGGAFAFLARPCWVVLQHRAPGHNSGRIALLAGGSPQCPSQHMVRAALLNNAPPGGAGHGICRYGRGNASFGPSGHQGALRSAFLVRNRTFNPGDGFSW